MLSWISFTYILSPGFEPFTKGLCQIPHYKKFTKHCQPGSSGKATETLVRGSRCECGAPYAASLYVTLVPSFWSPAQLSCGDEICRHHLCPVQLKMEREDFGNDIDNFEDVRASLWTSQISTRKAKKKKKSQMTGCPHFPLSVMSPTFFLQNTLAP